MIKSRVQGDHWGEAARYRGSWHCLKLSFERFTVSGIGYPVSGIRALGTSLNFPLKGVSYSVIGVSVDGMRTSNIGAHLRGISISISIMRTPHKSNPKDLRPFKPLFRVMRRHDMTKKIDKDKDNDKDKGKDILRTPPKSNHRDL